MYSEPFVSSLKTHLRKAEKAEYKNIIQPAGWTYKVGVCCEKFSSRDLRVKEL